MKKKMLNFLRYKVKQIKGNEEKIFIIGRNKTGTTSLKELFEKLGYIVGSQEKAELFIDEYSVGEFGNILKYCDSAEVFQDAPFSWPNTYKHIYKKYPNAKYILSIRDNSDEWYNSLLRFHKKKLGIDQDKDITPSDLKQYFYREKGFLWKSAKCVYGADEDTLYNKKLYTENYNNYNQEVLNFFEGKENFICINLKDKDISDKLSEFLNIDKRKLVIPHSNKSQ